MNKLRQKWYTIPIRSKVILLAGVILAALWTLVALVMIQLHSFSGQSAIIMEEYMDITGFMDAFSAENVYLEVHIRQIPPRKTIWPRFRKRTFCCGNSTLTGGQTARASMP